MVSKITSQQDKRYAPEIAQLFIKAVPFSKIVDYKSSFTRNHSLGVAAIADKMAD